MRLIELFESLEDWNTGRWVHYTDVDYMKIHLQSWHHDPLGVYFFPEKFDSFPMWQNKKYRFVATLKPGTKILDCSKITMDQLNQLIDATGVRETYEEYTNQYPPKTMKKRFDMFWEKVQQASYTTSSKAKLNKAFRQAGYDAIFDDTGAIHSNEVQLMVLNPRVIKVIDFERIKRPAFAAIQKVIADMKTMFFEYGTIEVEGPKRIPDGWSSSSPKILMATFNIDNDEKYARFKIRYNPDERSTHNNSKIDISLAYSNPSLNYGTGATYDFAKGEYQKYGDLEKLKKDLDAIFFPEKELA